MSLASYLPVPALEVEAIIQRVGALKGEDEAGQYSLDLQDICVYAAYKALEWVEFQATKLGVNYTCAQCTAEARQRVNNLILQKYLTCFDRFSQRDEAERLAAEAVERSLSGR